MVAVSVTIFAGLLLMSGAVLAHLIGASSVLTFFLIDRGRFLAAVPQRILGHIDLFSIMSMPLFIMAGEVMNRAGVTRALLEGSALKVRLTTLRGNET